MGVPNVDPRLDRCRVQENLGSSVHSSPPRRLCFRATIRRADGKEDKPSCLWVMPDGLEAFCMYSTSTDLPATLAWRVSGFFRAMDDGWTADGIVDLPERDEI